MYKFKESYLIKIPANATAEEPVMYAEHQHDNGSKVIEVFANPENFLQESFGFIASLVKDEMIEKGLYDKMKVTIKVEYEQKPSK